MPTPSTTVLMTVYNGMPYIRETVKSIFEQSVKDFTFLILNNGSTDGTGEFLDQTLAARTGSPPHLTVKHLPENIGRTAVLNRGLALVETELTAIIDADDLAMPERLARQTSFFRDNPDIDLVGCDVIYIDGTGNILGKDRYPLPHSELCARLPLHNQFAHAACMFRTQAARDAGGYPTAFPYAQDFALWIAMLAGGSRAASIPEPLARIRVHKGQATRDLKLVRVRAEDNHKLAVSMLGIPGLSPLTRQAARLRSAGALLRLGRHKAALLEFWKGICEAPWGLPCNPIIWQRLSLEISRWLRPRHP